MLSKKKYLWPMGNSCWVCCECVLWIGRVSGTRNGAHGGGHWIISLSSYNVREAIRPWNVLQSTVLYCTLHYCSEMNITVLNCTLLNSTVLYCPVLYWTVLHSNQRPNTPPKKIKIQTISSQRPNRLKQACCAGCRRRPFPIQLHQ